MTSARRLELAGGTIWLVDPIRARPYLLRALAAPCPSAREVVKERRRRLTNVARLVADARPSTGVTLLSEERLDRPQKPIRALKGRVGVLPILGPVSQRLTPEILKAGGTSMEDVTAGLEAMLADRSIDGIVLDCDSPGGSAGGLQELADRIYAARQVKKVYSVANSQACSASYWLASSAEQMMIAPLGEAGSIGVYVLHEDRSKADEEEGVRVQFIFAGRHKTLGNPHEPLDAEARAHLQSSVDSTYQAFLDAVKRNRSTTLDDVRRNYGEGRVMTARECVQVGAVDREMTLSQLLDRLTGQVGPDGANGQRIKEQEQRQRQMEQTRRKGGV